MSCNYRAELHILGSDILTFLAGEFVPIVWKDNYYSNPLIQIRGEVGKDLIFGGGVKLGPNPEKIEFAFHVWAIYMKNLQNGLEPVSLISQKESKGASEVKVTVHPDSADFKVEENGKVTVKLRQEAQGDKSWLNL